MTEQMGYPVSAVATVGVGVCYLTLCVPKEMPLADVEAAANAEHPTGVGPWRLSADPLFADGVHPNPCVCHHDPSRLHRLLDC